MSRVYDHKIIEIKWRKKWKEDGIYEPDLDSSKKPFFNLMMFPYPSAEGLHVGNMYAFTGADIYGRFKRMNGMDVFEPIGLDGFGIHSENYAIKIGRHPKEHAKLSEKNFYRQLSEIGNGFAWNEKLETYDPDYYRWTQWLFVQMFKKGLAYRGTAHVNWCPSCKTVLADEQVENNKCERCKNEVTRRKMTSWYFKITKYADRLLKNIEKIDWPEKIKTAQKNWIGKSEGMIIKFNSEIGDLEVFTTRPDTLNAVTFLATSKLYKKGDREKNGKFSGKYATHPLTGKKVPIWDTNYVSPDYGTGIVMGVPAHDERDMKFAKKYDIDIVKKDPDKKLWQEIEEKGFGKKDTNYHLRDWLISRQRYWGPPIPMINCKKCGWQSVPEKDLPVELPDIQSFKPKGDGKSPLSNAPDSWKIVDCPECGGKAERELDVSDTFLDSSWYFLAYPNLATKEWKEGKSPLNKKMTKHWLPVDAYIGGAEHAVLHLLYARFMTMALKDWGYLNFEEPFPFLFSHGLIIKDGKKMSKSRGNVVNPDEYIEKYGADTLRMYLMFLGSYDSGGNFRDSGIAGMSKFLKRVWILYEKTSGKDSEKLLTKLHQTIKKVTQDIGNFKYNTSIASIMELVNVMQEEVGYSKGTLKFLVQLIAPFAPHIAEELWSEIGQKGSIHTSEWPKYEENLIVEDVVVVAVQINGKLRATLEMTKEKAGEKKEVIKRAKMDKNIKKWMAGKKIKKEIFVSGKIINFVI